MTVSMIGWAHTKFGRLDADDLESLIVRVSRDALADAGVSASEVDEVVIGTMNGGFVRQGFPASLVFQADSDFRFKPSTRVENACATGSAAIHQGIKSIKAGTARIVLVVGVEKMTEVTSKEAGEVLLSASYVKQEAGTKNGFTGVFGEVAQSYFDKYGNRSEALARIAAKNHRNGAANPLAHLQKDLGFDFCNEVSMSNPIITGPLRRTDCSAISDGAAAIVLAAPDVASTATKAVSFRGVAHVNDFLPVSRRDVLAFEGPAKAWSQALNAAGVKLSDLSFAEVHDCFTIAELLIYEAIGLTPRGEGSRAIEEGWTEKGGRLPINPSGGLKAKGHPIGATGVSMHVMSANQLTNNGGGTQIPGAKLAGVFNMGGLAVANYASVLERAR